MRELAIASKHARQEDKLTKHTKVPHSLEVSDVATAQNQPGPHATVGDRSGNVV